MTPRWCALFVLAASLGAAAPRTLERHTRTTRNEYKMCVPENLYDMCLQMSFQETKSSAKIVCISARDRFECIEKIQQRIADFGPVDPEDMYLASQLPQKNLAIFEEVRTKEEPNAEYRYEAVAVIRKNLNISKVSQIAGLKSCHTGVGRNVGYKIPITKLKKMGVIGHLADSDISPRENELKALSGLFSKACIVGKWSPDPQIDDKLKKKYANLCQLCERPEKCDYPDNFSGYEGALKCLAHNGGQIAWTKVIFVKKFFGLPVGTSPAKSTKENPDDYAYFCPDGSTVSIREQPCTWAARPWSGYMTNAKVVKTIDDLRRKLENLGNVGTKSKAAWLEKVLGVNDKTVLKENKVIPPGDYLDKANYTDVVERDYGPPFKIVRICVTSNDELTKCKILSKAAFSRDIRPRFDCVIEKTTEDCMKTVSQNGADVINLDGDDVYTAEMSYNLVPILAEQYGDAGASYYTVAVVKKNSAYQSFSDLKGARSCHTEIDRTAGYTSPVYALMNLGLINNSDCNYAKSLANFFTGGSCLPGANDKKYEMDENVRETLCKLCIGDESGSSKCSIESSERYSGYTGAFRCLAEDAGDVAFVKHVTVVANTDQKNLNTWAVNLKSKDFELLCSDGRRASVEDYKNCYLIQPPPHTIVTSSSKTEGEIDELRNALLSASTQYSTRPDLFKMFGTFGGKKNLLFKDSTTGLISINKATKIQENYNNIMKLLNSCKEFNTNLFSV